MNQFSFIVSLLFLSLINTGLFAQPKLMLPISHTGQVMKASFSPDSKKIITVGLDGTAKLWEAASGKMLIDFKAGGDASIAMILSAEFSPDGKKIIITYESNSSRIVDISTGKDLWEWLYNDHDVPAKDILRHFSPDGKRIILFGYQDTVSYIKSPVIYNTETTKPIFVLTGHKAAVYRAAYSSDGKKIVTAHEDSTIKIWDATTAKSLVTIKDQEKSINTVMFSADGKKIFVVSSSNDAIIFDAATGKKIAGLPRQESQENEVECYFTTDGKRVIKLSGEDYSYVSGYWKYYDSLTYWDMQTGKLLFKTSCHVKYDNNPFFSKDEKKIIVVNNDSTVSVWDAVTGKMLSRLKEYKDINAARFSPDGKWIVTGSVDHSVKIWDAENGSLITEIKGQSAVNDVRFSPDGKKIVAALEDRSIKIWDAGSGRQLTQIKGKNSKLYGARFSPDGKNIILSTVNSTLVWNTETGSLIKSPVLTDSLESATLEGTNTSPDGLWTIRWAVYMLELTNNGDGPSHTFWSPEKELYYDAGFSPDSKKILITTNSGVVKLIDIATEKLLYTFITVDSSGFLVADAGNHYDGPAAARKLLHFTCGDEVIELDQVKDQLWVPNLADRINKGDSINAKTLDQLNICGLTPQVEEIKAAATGYQFKITPRRGGLGETVLYVNGIEVKRYKPGQLQKKAGVYQLLVNKQELDSLFVAGIENAVTVKAYTSDNTISSRGLVIEEDKTKQTATIPNLYAVLVGVSDYKDDNLDLQYAAKDATDISNALAAASRRLLNTDGKEHVFIYTLTTNADRYLLPEKISIKKTFQQISAKATANDILFIFFSGHGVMQGTDIKKQFYFLTTEASNETVTRAIANVGISTSELTEWIKPGNIKAQKRILILDACNSGQAIRDFVQFGKPAQGYIAARSDEKGQQIKAIEQLNNQSGLFILSASATDQSAFEMGRYSQGLLTYSLLKAIKQQPDILAGGKYLDVSNWLNAAKKTVSLLADESGARQEPQLNANNNFNIGLVDEEVRSKIFLADAKALFARSNFLNTDIIADNLKLGNAIDKQLGSISSDNNAAITYSADYEGADAYLLSGKYSITGETVSITVVLTKGGAELHRYEIKGVTSDIKNVAISITTTATDWLKKK